MKLSLIIPARDKNDPKLAELLRSIEAQDFPKNEMEVLVITEGTSESAKTIGIRKAKGEVIGILASDNELINNKFLSEAYFHAEADGSSQPLFYSYTPDDNLLNRYFSLVGCNDLLAMYMGKRDKAGWNSEGGVNLNFRQRTLGDNGFFIRRNLILKTDLDNYYHIDNAVEAVEDYPYLMTNSIWHKTGGNIFSFFRKRYRYGLQHAFNKNRRWHLVDFRQPKDIVRLICFIVFTVTIIEPFILSVRGYLKIRDLAWLLHPVICLITLLTYSILIVHLAINRMFQSLSAPMAVQKA